MFVIVWGFLFIMSLAESDKAEEEMSKIEPWWAKDKKQKAKVRKA
jgi:hypothetical protein